MVVRGGCHLVVAEALHRSEQLESQDPVRAGRRRDNAFEPYGVFFATPAIPLPHTSSPGGNRC